MSICLYVHVAFCLFLYFFFFSSRRRHTRWPRDWSSDVCSSDLNRWVEAWYRGSIWLYALLPLTGLFRVIATMRRRYLRRFRSEERRVGKECTSRWWPRTVKKNREKDVSDVQRKRVVVSESILHV